MNRSRNIVIPVLEINNYKFSNKKLYDLTRNQGDKAEFERFYTRSIYTDYKVVVNEINSEIYIRELNPLKDQ